jgi:mannose-1-phosphate guanylyltransferase
MKAIILAAGKGERLKSVTDHLPKPMIVYEGKPVLEHNIDLCKKYGATEIYINLHHLSEIIQTTFGDGSKYGVTITYSHEDSLLGTAGAVKKIAQHYWQNRLGDEEPFLIVYGDMYTDYNIDLLFRKMVEVPASAVIGFHHREDTQHFGVAEMADNGRITRFIEKPKPGESNSRWVNVGIYLMKPEMLEWIPEGFFDFGKDVFPDLLNKGVQLFGVCDEKDVKMFDTLELYHTSLGHRHVHKGIE